MAKFFINKPLLGITVRNILVLLIILPPWGVAAFIASLFSGPRVKPLKFFKHFAKLAYLTCKADILGSFGVKAYIIGFRFALGNEDIYQNGIHLERFNSFKKLMYLAVFAVVDDAQAAARFFINECVRGKNTAYPLRAYNSHPFLMGGLLGFFDGRIIFVRRVHFMEFNPKL